MIDDDDDEYYNGYDHDDEWSFDYDDYDDYDGKFCG